MLKVMRANIHTTILYRVLLILTGVLLLGSSTVLANSEQQLRNRANELQQQVEEGQQSLNQTRKQVNTLQGRVNQLNAEINDIQGKINQTQDSIAKTEEQLKKTQRELSRQENIMRESLRTLYKHGNISTVELLASSESFSQFVSAQDYLERVKTAVQKSAEEVARLRDKLQNQKESLNEMLELQTGQKKIVDAKRAEQADLLNQAKDKEFSYKKYVEKKKSEQEKAEERLAALIRAQSQSGNWTSQGSVNSNSIIGYTGNTGFSFGAHLHFSIIDGNGNYLDPVQNRATRTLKWGFTWPYNANYPVSRWFDCTNFEAFATSSHCVSSSNPNGYFHRGVDVAAPAGTPVRAIGPGEIICRSYSCMGSSGGGTVIIRHPNGLTSVYNHMVL